MSNEKENEKSLELNFALRSYFGLILMPEVSSFFTSQLESHCNTDLFGIHEHDLHFFVS